MFDGGILFIGDTHIGKRFRTGVPLNRLGEREELIYQLFREQLYDSNPDIRYVVHLGDLFDRPVVSYDDLYRTYNLIKIASEAYPERRYIFIEGNHDMSRNTEVITAFDVLSEMFLGTEKVTFVKNTPYRFVGGSLGDDFLLCIPYSYNNQLLEEGLWDSHVLEHHVKNIILCGHFDEPFPVDKFSQCKKVVTGHIHTPKMVGDNIYVVGSIIPMNFAEDPNGNLYQTVTLEQLTSVDPSVWEDKCVRVILKDNETLPENFNCMQLISISADEEDRPISLEELEFEVTGINTDWMLKKALEDTGLYDEVYQKYLELKAELNV